MIEQIEFRKTYYLPVRVTEFNHEVGDEEPTVRLENLSGRHQLVDFEQNIMNELVEIDLRIDQPKPVVPQFVADWLKEYRYTHTLLKFLNAAEKEQIATSTVNDWILDNQYDFIKAWIDGYDIEVEETDE